MNGAFVADSSVGVAWVAQSQSSRETDGLLDEAMSGAAVVVPIHWNFELANALLGLVRRGRITHQDVAAATGHIRGLNVKVDEEGHRFAFDEVWRLATEHHLSIYDAAYLELAARRQLPLASRDKVLNKAARACGVRTLV